PRPEIQIIALPRHARSIRVELTQQLPRRAVNGELRRTGRRLLYEARVVSVISVAGGLRDTPNDDRGVTHHVEWGVRVGHADRCAQVALVVIGRRVGFAAAADDLEPQRL